MFKYLIPLCVQLKDDANREGYTMKCCLILLCNSAEALHEFIYSTIPSQIHEIDGD